jgi:lysozyme
VKFVVIDRCPVPAEIAEQVKQLKRDVPGAVLQSAYRGDQAAGLLKRLGKSTQAMLYSGWLRRLPGFNPANPPGRSTHELRSDGVAYRGPVGRPIKAWGCGLDFNDGAVPKLIAAAKHRGWVLFQPYKSGSEYHHLNFKRFPKHGTIRKRRLAKLVVKQERARKTDQVTKAGVKFIASFEGFRATPYRPVPTEQFLTIGYGHYGPDVGVGRRVTKEQALELLDKDIERFERGVADLVHVPLTPLQFDALVSLAYNIGLGNLKTSTLLRELNKKHYAVAANQFLRWDKGDRHSLAGLTRRRKAERAVFLKGSSAKARAAASVR